MYYNYFIIVIIGFNFFLQATAVLLSPNGTLDSPALCARPVLAAKNFAPGPFGKNRQGRRASRSFADLYALASLQVNKYQRLLAASIKARGGI